jgi:phage antirepressor YoqD-like protein
MNEVARQGDKRMTVREVADVLGVTDEAIKKHIRELYPTLMQERVTTVLNEAQITEIKRRMRLTTKVASTITALETAESIARTCGYAVETVRRIIRELGFSENGVKTVLTQEQAEVVKRCIVANLSQGTNNTNRPTTTVVVGAEDPTLELASLYARIDEIKSARIAALEAENAEKAERLSIAEPKAETLDKITASESDISVRELAAILALPHMGQNNFFDLLRKDGYIDGYNCPYRRYIEAGLM